MTKSKRLDGFEIEDWLKDVAKKTGILNESPFKAERTIQLFNQRLHQRLGSARSRIANYYVDGEKWIEQAINNQALTGISSQVKNEFVNRLADLVMATDLVFQVKNTSGQTIQIAVDVTTDKQEVDNKLRKVKGYPSKDMVSKANKNIPEVRASLGIDKHLILVLNRTISLLPSHETILNAVYAFAESPTITKAIDLTKLEPKDRYNWRVEYEADPERMWKRYTQSFNTKPTAVLGLEVAKHALRENHSPKAVLNMLTQDPQYREYLRRDGGDRTRADIHAQGLLGKAQAELEQVRLNEALQIAKGIGLVLENYGEAQPDGSIEFAGNTLVILKTQDEIVVREKRNGAEIFHLKEGKLLKYSPNSELKSKVNTLVKAIQEQKLQPQQMAEKQQSAKRSR